MIENCRNILRDKEDCERVQRDNMMKQYIISFGESVYCLGDQFVLGILPTGNREDHVLEWCEQTDGCA